MNRVLQRVASIFMSLVGLFLLGFVVVALVGAVIEAWPALLRGEYGHAAIEGLDGAFLVVILLELVHTTLSKGAITRQLQEFIVVGVTASVRTGLEIAAASRNDLHSAAINMSLNSVGVLVLVGALWVVRRMDRARARAQAAWGRRERGRSER